MATTARAPPTYHVVPRFDIPAHHGPLELGTVVADLASLKPLNHGARIVPAPPHPTPYAPVTQRGFRATKEVLRSGRFDVWARVLGLGLGGGVGGGAQVDGGETVACDEVVTTYFDADAGYVARSLAVKGVHDYLVGSGLKGEVFLVTGLKVAKKLTFGGQHGRQLDANVDISAEAPQGVPIEAGFGISGEKGDFNELEFSVDDIVVGFRVSRFRYKRASTFPWLKARMLTEEEYIEGAEMLIDQEDQGQQQAELDFEELPVEGEAEALEAATAADRDVDELWVEPEGP